MVGIAFLAAFVASCFLGALPPVLFLAVCLVLAIVFVGRKDQFPANALVVFLFWLVYQSMEVSVDGGMGGWGYWSVGISVDGDIRRRYYSLEWCIDGLG